MKRSILYFAITLFVSVIYAPAYAQVDPSNSLLLKPGTQDTNADDDSAITPTNLDNGRYMIKPVVAPSSRPQPAPSLVPRSQLTVTRRVAPAAAKVPEAAATPVAALPAPATKELSDHSFVQSVQDTMFGGSSDELAHYREKLQADDPRHNILEISVAPGFFYTSSSSSYWYRRYFSGGPGIDADVHMWLTPFMGVNIGYFTTLSADVNADPTTTRAVHVDHRYTDFAFDFRKYFSYSKKSPSLRFGIGYSEYQMIVPPTEANRIGLQEYGLDLGLHLTLPTSNTSAWALGTDVLPFLKVNEQSTGMSAESGTNPSTFAVKFSLGQDFTLDRSNKVFWRINERVEKSIYSGTATQVDPITGTAPSGVSVTEMSTLFEFGYSWGD